MPLWNSAGRGKKFQDQESMTFHDGKWGEMDKTRKFQRRLSFYVERKIGKKIIGSRRRINIDTAPSLIDFFKQIVYI